MGVNSTIFINFAILLGNVHLFIFVINMFYDASYETHNESSFLKYTVNQYN